MSATPETRALVRRIQDVRFTTGRVRTSYDMNDVDELLDRLVDLVEAGSDPRELVSTAEFRTVRWREGYTLGEVDNFLDALLLDPALSPGGPAVPATVTKAGGRAAPRRSGPPTGPTEPVPAADAGSRSARAAGDSPAPTPGGTTRRGGRTVGGMLLDHLEETGKPMPAGDTAALVTAAAERLDAEAAAEEVDVIKVAIELADIVLAAAAVAEHYGFTVEEAVREKTRLDVAGDD